MGAEGRNAHDGQARRGSSHAPKLQSGNVWGNPQRFSVRALDVKVRQTAGSRVDENPYGHPAPCLPSQLKRDHAAPQSSVTGTCRRGIGIDVHHHARVGRALPVDPCLGDLRLKRFVTLERSGQDDVQNPTFRVIEPSRWSTCPVFNTAAYSL